MVQQSYSGAQASGILGAVMAGSGVGGVFFSLIIPGIMEAFGWRMGMRAMGISWMLLLWLGMLVFIFIIPSDVITIPRYILFNELKLLGSPLAMVLPAALGQGLKSPIFILIFMQAFSALPKSYDEAAQLDGAGRLRVFFTVALPMAVPSIVLCLLFSLVWYWNETAQVALLIGGDFQTLPLQLDMFNDLFGASFSTNFGDTANRLNERYQFAATLLTILPLILFYLVMQKQFVKGVESSGITGE
jgi:multiple sugar transport system permease protein